MNQVQSVAVSDLPADVPLLDVRELDEWSAGHAPTARHVPMSELPGRMAEVPADEPLYVVCRSGGRSGRVVAYLAQQGYPAVNVDGGMQDWAASGRAVVTDDGSAPDHLTAMDAAGPVGPGTATPPSGRAAVPPSSCPRCGSPTRPGRGPFCPYCGRYLAALEWVALPPDPLTLPEAARPRPAPPRPARYEGPPRYRDVPRWGLPPGPWRTGSADGPPPTPLRQARSSASQLSPLLLVTAALAAVGAVGEVWRYVLLLISRTEALSPTAVAWSDSLVFVGGLLSVVGVLACGLWTIMWTRHAVRAAAERSGTRPQRSSGMLIAGWLVPGLNLAVPGAVLAEIEHAALGLPPDRRPRPSRELLLWWALWGSGVVLSAVTLLWSLRSGTQALADGVVLHAVLDVLAVATALLTRRVVARLTWLLEPSTGAHRELLVTSRPAQ